MTLMEWLDKWDKIAFIAIHRDLANGFLDTFFLIIRNALTWIPLYCLVLYFSLTRFKKSALLFILLSIITFALCDRLSAGWLKPMIGRARPCFDPAIQPYLRKLIDCGGRNSFPSSHAANHFGLASFWYGTILYNTGKKWNWLWLWAFIICYAQVYVGKHYPLDVGGGALLGVIIGTAMAKLFEQWPHIKRLITNKFATAKSVET